MNVIKVSDFSKFPGPRYKKLGSYSGEEFRDTVLIPAIEKGYVDLVIDLDGVFGFGSSFLEEAFGGLVRQGVGSEVVRQVVSNIRSEEQPELKSEISEYVEAELSNKR